MYPPKRGIVKSLLSCLALLSGGSAAYAEITTALQFVPVTPCRIIDTRNATGTFGGPIIAGGATRDVPVPQSACGIPGNARAYSMNITVVPPAGLSYLSIWPTGQTQPLVSTLNALDGRIAANAAIVPAGVNGSVSVFVSNSSHVLMDINGYFVPSNTASSLAFYPTPPCRVADTRPVGLTGAFGPPALVAQTPRSFPITGSGCNIPTSAQAFSLNITVVPNATLGFLSAWPTGQSQPVVSTLNSLDGDIIANAAIVPAGTNGGVTLYSTDATNVIIDINGYFAPPGSPGAVSLYTLPPCRVADTRGNGSTGLLGTPSLVAGAARAFPIPDSPCSAPATASAYSLNATLVPPAAFGYLTMFPTGQAQPTVSTLNSLRGKVLANAALVPAGTNGWVNVFPSNVADLVLDINGFFGPSGSSLSPLILSSAVTSANVNAAYSYAVLASNPNPTSTLTFSLPTAPSGMTINSATGLIGWTPTLGQVGAQSVQVRVSDTLAHITNQNFTVNVVAPLPTDPVNFTTGTSTVLTNQTIPNTGGTITISGSNTAINGARIVFPAGAVSASTPVRVSYNPGGLTPNVGTYSGASVVIDVTGNDNFTQPVSITVPYNGGSNSVPVPYYVEPGGGLRPVQITAIDRQAGTFTFETFHASTFTWLYNLLNPTTAVAGTAFTPANDGFQITNFGSTVNREGECFGMTSWGLWWLAKQKASLGSFYPKYMASVGTDSDGATIRGQNVIATRAFTSIAQKWTAYIPLVSRQQNLTPADRFASIYNIVANTRQPVLIYLYHTNNAAGAHSVLAYQVDNSTKNILIYDPNKPGTVQNISYSTATNNFNQYCNPTCYDGIVYNGDGSLNLTEPYTNILADAQSNFSNSAGATINITSHVTGQVVSNRLLSLVGTVSSSQVLVTRITAIVGSVEYTVAVPLSGAFTIPIALVDGLNRIKFRTEGNNSNGVLITTGNNFNTKDFTLRAVVPASVILMTLTWDRNDTDVDTYVIDPTGDYSAYYHRVTADGGTLDRDVTTGYGPEHWTLLNSNVVRYNQPYKFRIHYYSDHGNGPTNYAVTIELYNGTPRQATYTYTGSLSVSSPGNSAPTGTGPDWRDIATVILTPSASSNGLDAGPSTTTDENGRLTITVPVPDAATRIQLKR